MGHLASLSVLVTIKEEHCLRGTSWWNQSLEGHPPTPTPTPATPLPPNLHGGFRKPLCNLM